jgi:class III poly(R)-hydroxyalkanoic acid synthase PhaE subunit
MNESGPRDPKATQEWIDQERERLRGEGEHANEQPGSEAWIHSLREWLKLMKPGVAGAFGVPGQDELSQTLQGLGAAHQGIMDALAKIPPLGLTGRYFEPWTRLQAADAEYRKVEERFREGLLDVHLKTLDELERRLKSRKSGPTSERELYDLWVECGEAVFAKIAHSVDFAQLQGAMSNAAVHRVRAQKAVLEQIARMYDMPTRSELNTVHHQVRTMRLELEVLQARSVKIKRAAKAKPSAKRTHAASKVSRGRRRKASR